MYIVSDVYLEQILETFSKKVYEKPKLRTNCSKIIFFNSKHRFSKGGEPPQYTLKYMSGVCKVELLRFLM